VQSAIFPGVSQRLQRRVTLYGSPFSASRAGIVGHACPLR